MGSLFLLCISTILQRERIVYVAGKRFPLKNAVFQRQIAACGAVFRNGDRAGVQIEVFLAERLPRGYMCMAVQENIAGAARENCAVGRLFDEPIGSARVMPQGG